MFRKLAIAAAAVAALGAASLTASTPAAAWGKGGGGFGGGFHHFHGGGLRIYTGVGLYDYDSCYRTRTYINRRGELVRAVVNICD
jgi:hypothetical protein